MAEFSVVFDTVLFPFRVEDLLDSLPHIGFVVTETLETRFAARVAMAGSVATKGDLRLSVDTQRQFVALRGRSFSEVLQAFDDVETLLESEIGLNVESDARYYELQMQGFITSKKMAPLRALSDAANQNILERLSKVWEQKVANFSLRLVTPNTPPNSVEWFDFRIEPEVSQPEETYYFYWVYRNRAKSDVVSRARESTQKVIDTINTLERGNAT